MLVLIWLNNWHPTNLKGIKPAYLFISARQKHYFGVRDYPAVVRFIQVLNASEMEAWNIIWDKSRLQEFDRSNLLCPSLFWRKKGSGYASIHASCQHSSNERSEHNLR